MEDQEPNNNNGDKTISWSSESNWSIAHGSLNTSLTFESSDSPFVSDSLNPTAKSPLILKPTSPDCGPCEIKLSFKQTHEVRQVYIRSTARVYEIYSAPSLSSISEYLCTVRCGIAERDEEIGLATDTEEPVCAQLNRSAEEMAKGKFKSEGSNSTNEDDWVEVKVPDAPPQDNVNTKVNVQDFYEATAEITDADPCISLTLRLLSLQNKDRVYVDEIYVFADPVEAADSENQGVQMGNSAGSSLSAMLFPTLLQLSKTGFSRAHDKNDSNITERREMGSTAADIANITEHEKKSSVAAQQDMKLQDLNRATAEQPRFPTVLEREKKLDPVAKNYSPYIQLERTLEQLVSRVASVEDICLRFEESMLKPIRGIEARLQSVEKQLEVVSKYCNCTVRPSGTRICAPEFTCEESNSSSFYNEGIDNPVSGQLESEKMDLASNKLSNPSDDTPISVNDTHFHPCLVVTAPEFSCGDDEEDDDALKLSNDSPQGKPKQALSIDDALAAALSGFLAATVAAPSNYTRALTVQAPEFTIEENGNDDVDEIASQNVQNEQPIVPSVSFHELPETEFVNKSNSNFRDAVVEDMGSVERNHIDDYFKESFTVDEQDQSYELTETDDCQITKKTDRIEASNEVNEVLVLGKNDILKLFPGNPTYSVASSEDITEESKKDNLPDVFLSSSDSSVLDFDIPILDVKFSSSRNSNTKSPFEALLTDMPEFDSEAVCNPESDVLEQSNLVYTEDEESMVPVTVECRLVDLDGNDVRDMPPSTLEGEELEDSYKSSHESSQEMFASLI